MGFCLLSAMEAFTRSFFWWPYRISCLIRLSPVLVAGRVSRCFRSLPLVLVFSALRDGDAFSNASSEFRANLFEAMRGIFCRLDPENCESESENGNSKEFNTQKKKKKIGQTADDTLLVPQWIRWLGLSKEAHTEHLKNK